MINNKLNTKKKNKNEQEKKKHNFVSKKRQIRPLIYQNSRKYRKPCKVNKMRYIGTVFLIQKTIREGKEKKQGKKKLSPVSKREIQTRPRNSYLPN